MVRMVYHRLVFCQGYIVDEIYSAFVLIVEWKEDLFPRLTTGGFYFISTCNTLEQCA